MFLDDPVDESALVVPTASAVVLVAVSVVTVLLGLLPWPLLEVAGEALPL
jgi:hypothetical protein